LLAIAGPSLIQRSGSGSALCLGLAALAGGLTHPGKDGTKKEMECFIN
jgi:hypothetical protein